MFFRQSLLFEIVKCEFKTLISQPSACFFDCVAIGNAVNGNAGVFHGDRCLENLKCLLSQRQSYPYENIE